MLLRWIARRAGWDGNPLRRASDRLEAGFTAMLIAVLLVAGPWTGWRVAESAYRDQVRTATWERKHRVAVEAILLEDAAWPPGLARYEGRSAPPSVLVPARWTAPGSVVHTGSIVVDAGNRAGTSIRIWIDDRGNLATHHATGLPAVSAFFLGLAAVLVVAGSLAALRRLARWFLQRRRLRSWQTEWMVVEPWWSGRGPK
jgi:hypothetical protein